MSRTTSQSSAASAIARTSSIKTNTGSPQSDIKLFVTNLRLIDLDLRPDWPNITVQTFSSRNADQKQRIGGVEWSLFRLFEIWDPQETSQKLQPFFPPLEPLQSLNLRAALYRCLNDLKKNGFLGRETVLRKTMLDECKGEKFFELLATFSNAVLKKVLFARDGRDGRTAIARTLATATALPSYDQASLLPLAIAHKAALVNVLRMKDEKRRRFTEFQALLDTKTVTIDERIKQCKATPRSQKHTVSEREAGSIKKQLKDNWIGDQRWLEILLRGDGVEAKDAFMTMQFNDVWSLVEKGCRLEDAAPEPGLLESLQSRVQQQQSRLQRWRVFYETLCQEEPVGKSQDAPPRSKVEDISFHDHLKLQLQPTSPSHKSSVQKNPLRSKYNMTLMAMDAELSNASRRAYSRTGGSHLPRRRTSVDSLREPVHRPEPISGPVPPQVKRTALAKPPSDTQPRTLHGETTITPLDSEATLVGHSATVSQTLSRTLPPSEVPTGAVDTMATADASDSPAAAPLPPEVHQTSPQPPSCWPSEPPALKLPSLNPEDALAEQIISSIGNATPSPVKRQPRPSLVERTRMSLAHTTTFEPVPDAFPQGSPLLPELPELTVQPVPALDQPASLLERTRLSMAAMSHNSRPTQPAKDKRKSRSRQSLFPVNQFDTPRSRKSFEIIEETKSGDSTPKEVLFSDDIDYEHVFKSRPRVAHSPVFAPPPAGSDTLEEAVDRLNIAEDDEFDEGITGVDLADVDADDEDGFTQAWDNSPLRHAGGGMRVKGKLVIQLRHD